MPGDPKPRKSFSAWSRFGIRLDFALRTVLVLAVVVMVNYLGGRWFERFTLSAQTRQPLSPLTVGLLRSLTNQVKVTLYYDKEDPLFTTVSALLNDYRNENPRIQVTTVDYLWDAGTAEKLKRDHPNYFIGVTNKNLIIFDCDGRVKAVNGDALGQYAYDPVAAETGPDGKPVIKFDRRITAFLGEKMFTSALLAVMNPRPLTACYLTGHGEHSLTSADETGYLTFAAVLQQNYIQVQPLVLTGTNPVPLDCNLLIIAGPATPLTAPELERIDEYLRQGGRLLTLFSYASLQRPTGLENILAGWGVDVGRSLVEDRNFSVQGQDLKVMHFSSHPIVNALAESALHLMLPRSVARLDVGTPPADAPRVEEIAFTSPGATIGGRSPKQLPLAVAAEKGRVPGVVTERGSTRLVVVGDSLFLGNQMIESVANRDFAAYAVNWLLERPYLMEGIGPRPIKEFRLTMTTAQMRNARWVLLAGMPGAILLLGGLVWWRRRA